MVLRRRCRLCVALALTAPRTLPGPCLRRQHDVSTPPKARVLLWYLRIENLLVLLAAFFVNLCVTCLFAYGFYGNPDYQSERA